MKIKPVKLVHTFLFLAMVVGLTTPVVALEYGDMGSMGHGAMVAGAKKIQLGQVEVEGVKAQAHLDDVSQAMAAAGMQETHHLMLAFTDAGSGREVGDGLVAVKVSGPDLKAGAPVKMMAMDGSFGADLNLAKPGSYNFEIGTKLADGKKRQFRFSYIVK
jgi:hypothetical protein